MNKGFIVIKKYATKIIYKLLKNILLFQELQQNNFNRHLKNIYNHWFFVIIYRVK